MSSNGESLAIVVAESGHRSMPVHESRLVSMTARSADSHEIELFSGGGRIYIGADLWRL